MIEALQTKPSPAALDGIKVVAFFAMVIDHINTAAGFDITELQLIGRIAFPLFAFVWGVNINRHKISQKSLNRMWLLALLCQPSYFFAFKSVGFSLTSLNILFSFAIAGQVLKAVLEPSVCNVIAATGALLLMPWMDTSYELRGLLLLLASAAVFKFWFEYGRKILVALWISLAIFLNLPSGLIFSLTGGVMATIVLYVLCNQLQHSFTRFMPGGFFIIGYSMHLFLIGIYIN